VCWSTEDVKGATAPVPKMAEVVCAHNYCILGERGRSRFCKRLYTKNRESFLISFSSDLVFGDRKSDTIFVAFSAQ